MTEQQTPTEMSDEALDRLHADVMTVPPDRNLLAMVDRIIQTAHVAVDSSPSRLAMQLGIIEGTAERLRAALR
jgi:hypothetical protein